jgi:hypothetical protein
VVVELGSVLSIGCGETKCWREYLDIRVVKQQQNVNNYIYQYFYYIYIIYCNICLMLLWCLNQEGPETIYWGGVGGGRVLIHILIKSRVTCGN